MTIWLVEAFFRCYKLSKMILNRCFALLSGLVSLTANIYSIYPKTPTGAWSGWILWLKMTQSCAKKCIFSWNSTVWIEVEYRYLCRWSFSCYDHSFYWGGLYNIVHYVWFQGALISACSDDNLHLWNFRQKKPEIVHSLKFQRESYVSQLFLG